MFVEPDVSLASGPQPGGMSFTGSSSDRVLSRHSSLASHSMAENGLAPSITVEQEMLGSVLPTVPWPLEAEPPPTCFLEGLPCFWGRGLEPRQKSKTEQMGVRRLG